MRLMYRLSFSFFWVWLRLFYGHRVDGAENLPKGPALIAANHLSYLDPPLLGASISEEVHFLAREGLFEVPLLRFWIRCLNAHPIKRSQQNIESFKLVCQLISEGKKVVLFPEVERSRDGNLLPMKQGIGMLALKTLCPIIPVYIEGTYEVWPKFQKYPKLSGKTRCVFGKAIDPKGYLHLGKKKAQEAIARDVGKAIAALRDQ